MPITGKASEGVVKDTQVFTDHTGFGAVMYI